MGRARRNAEVACVLCVLCVLCRACTLTGVLGGALGQTIAEEVVVAVSVEGCCDDYHAHD